VGLGRGLLVSGLVSFLAAVWDTVCADACLASSTGLLLKTIGLKIRLLIPDFIAASR